MTDIPSRAERKAAARSQLIRMLAERLVREALAEKAQPGAVVNPTPTEQPDAGKADDEKGGAA